MPPVSSLIFVVILAVWAVYLVQHWVRRRDHLATARSVDRFSEAMRVLERRRALPRPDLAEAAPRSYSLSPLRPAAPQVVVKRGAAAASSSAPVATAVAPSPAYRRARSAGRLRAVALLAASVVMVTLAVLGVAGVWPWWSTLVGIGLLAVTLAGVRASVARERRARMALRRRARAAAPPAAPAHVFAPAPAHAHAHAFAAQAAAAPVTPRARRTADLSRTVPAATARAMNLYDIDAVEAQMMGAAVVPDEPAAPAPVAAPEAAPATTHGWQPVPVPPPTYTLKARAVRATPGQLPVDGHEMALDEEFEDLPHISRVV